MKFNLVLNIITVAFIISLCGLVLSFVLPQNNVSDTLMIAALFLAAASGIAASVFTKKLVKSKQWYFAATGGFLLLIGFILQIEGSDFFHQVFKLSGTVISIVAFTHYIYLNRFDFKYNKWIWLIPIIITGGLFKCMHWPGGNIILFGGLLAIVVISIIELLTPKKRKGVRILLLIWQIIMCLCIAVFYFRYINLDSFSIGYLFVWLALFDILLLREKNMLSGNEFR